MSTSYQIFQPFVTTCDIGAESSIQKVAVNETDLNTLCQQLQLRPHLQRIGLFGELKSILQTITSLVSGPVLLLDEQLLHKISLFVIIKDDLLIQFVNVPNDFLHQTQFDKENIIVTLFRYLEDFSPDILLCADNEIKEKFFSRTKESLFIHGSPPNILENRRASQY